MKDGAIAFLCPRCGEAIEVDESMRWALLRHGCVLCGATVDEDAFSGTDHARA